MMFLVTIFILLAVAQSFISHSRTYKSSNVLTMGAWPKNRPPVPNPLIYKQKMDAAWGRGKFRPEVWDYNVVNPLNNWWEGYAPSQEEVEAAEQLYDFKNPKGWCERNNVDYEAGEKEVAAHLATQLAHIEEDEKSLNVKDFEAVTKEHLKLLNKAYLLALRVEDDVNQAKKGQPSLDGEDTGTQYKN